MRKLAILALVLLFTSCGKNNFELYEDVKELAAFNSIQDPVFIRYGKEDGFLEVMMEYAIYSTDSLNFQNLRKQIVENEQFEKGLFYLNFELNDYIFKRKLNIINIKHCVIYENKYDFTFRVFLFSDQKTFAICRINE